MKNKLSFVLAIVLTMMSLVTVFPLDVIAFAGYSDGDEVWSSNDGKYTAVYYTDDTEAINAGMVAKAEIPVENGSATAYFNTLDTVMSVGELCGADYFDIIQKSVTYTKTASWDCEGRSFTVNGNGCTIENTGNTGYFKFLGSSDDAELPSDESYTGVVFKNFTLKGKGTLYYLVQLGETNNEEPRPVKVSFENCNVIGYANRKYVYGIIDVRNNSSLVFAQGSTVTQEISESNVKSDDSYRGIYTGAEGAEIEINDANIELSGCVVGIDAATARLTVNGGSLVSQCASAIYARQGTVEINSGTFGVLNSNGITSGVVVAEAGASVTVNGGSFYDKSGSADWIFNNADTSNAKFVLKSATAWGNNNVFSGNGAGAIKTAAMLDGASVRTASDNTSGIRFQSTIDKTAFETLRGVDQNAVIGTLIAPYEYVSASGDVFTKNALSNAGKTYLDIPAENGMNEKDTEYVINAAMVNLKKNNYSRDFAAVSYISYQTSAGNTVTAYGAFDKDDNVRNIKEVAYCALSDVMVDGEIVTEADGDVTVNEAYAKSKGYVNVITEWYTYDRESGAVTLVQGKAYTEYSQSQIAVIKNYIAVDLG